MSAQLPDTCTGVSQQETQEDGGSLYPSHHTQPGAAVWWSKSLLLQASAQALRRTPGRQEIEFASVSVTRETQLAAESKNAEPQGERALNEN